MTAARKCIQNLVYFSRSRKPQQKNFPALWAIFECGSLY